MNKRKCRDLLYFKEPSFIKGPHSLGYSEYKLVYKIINRLGILWIWKQYKIISFKNSYSQLIQPLQQKPKTRYFKSSNKIDQERRKVMKVSCMPTCVYLLLISMQHKGSQSAYIDLFFLLFFSLYIRDELTLQSCSKADTCTSKRFGK